MKDIKAATDFANNSRWKQFGVQVATWRYHSTEDSKCSFGIHESRRLRLDVTEKSLTGRVLVVGRVEVPGCFYETKEIFVLNFKPFESNSLWVAAREEANCRKIFAMQAGHLQNIFLAGRGTLWSPSSVVGDGDSLVFMHTNENGKITQMALNGSINADIVMRLTGSDALVAGTSYESIGGPSSLYVQRVNKRPGGLPWDWQGIVQWASFDRFFLWKLCDMHLDDGGNSILYGLLNPPSEFSDQVLLASFDSSGGSRWSVKERPGVGQVRQCGSMQVFQDKVFIAGELVRSVPPRGDIFLMHFRNSTTLWAQREGGENLQHHFKAMHVDAVGQTLVAGIQTQSATLAAPGQTGIFLMKFSNHGDLIWKEYQETQTFQTMTMTAMWIHNAIDIALAGFALQNLSKTAHLRVLQGQGGAACGTDRGFEYNHFLPVLFLFKEKSRGWAQWQGKSVGPIRDVRTQEDANGKFSLVGIKPDATVSILSFDAAKAAASITSTSTDTNDDWSGQTNFALMIGLAAGALILFVIVISWFRCKTKGGGCIFKAFTRVNQEDEIKHRDADSDPEGRTSDSETGG
eukprot:Skav210642  [mRNA]  locus=scaffold3835:39500:42065:- [translate_table: standard]